jgi:hypothetical protein
VVAGHSAAISASRPTFGIGVADRDFSSFGMPLVIGPAGHEDRREVAEGGAGHDQAGHDLVADAEIERRVKAVVAERHGGGQRDHVAENSDSSIPGWPWVTPSHMAGTPPATCAVAPSAAARRRGSGRGRSRNGWWAESMSL